MAKESLLDQLAAEFAARAKKSTKKAAKYALEVNGNMMTQKPTTKKELKKAVQAIIVANPSAKINLYTLSGPVSMDLPVAGIDGGAE